MDDRIASLKAEFEKGQEELNRLEQRRQEIWATMLRISGAIQVLEELRQQTDVYNDTSHSTAA
jgi:chaperonin cofactor prefoldin